MGQIAEQYGYCDGGECLLVADNSEVWIFEICGGGPQWTAGSGAPGAHWVARRLGDDQVFVGANRSRVGMIDFDDPENFMWSTDITALPEELGRWKQGEPFNYSSEPDRTREKTAFPCREGSLLLSHGHVVAGVAVNYVNSVTADRPRR